MFLKSKLIYILGPEGAGKTTTANLLSHYIRSGWTDKVKITEIRSSHLYVYLLKSLLMKLGRVEYYKYPRGFLIKRIDRLYLSRIIKFLLFAELTAIVVLALIKVRLHLLLGYVVICTRYVIDTIIDLLAYTLVAPQGRLLVYKFIMPILLRLIPEGLPIIYLDANYDVLVKRYEERNSYLEPPNWISFYRSMSRAILRAVLGHYKVVVIDTSSKSRSQIFKEVLQTILT
ncbi:MAG: hypothetical protein QXS32_07520 [Candidatus Nezhaarchaeales archaeon]